MTILAIDPGLTTLGYAHAKAGYGTVKPGKVNGAERLRIIRDQVAALAVRLRAELIVMEGIGFASQKAAVQGELHGVLKVNFLDFGIPVASVAPTALKKYSTGKGNAKKERVLVEAVKRLQYDGSDHNVSDALWLLHMAFDHYGIPGRVKMPKIHREALAKVAWPEIRKAVA